jgi:hypothetical protein
MRRLIILDNNERALIVSSNTDGRHIVRTKKGSYKVITNKNIKTILR